MIKHGKVFPLKRQSSGRSTLEPIKEFVTKGVADSREDIFLDLKACDMKGAKRFDGQQCVIAKAMNRTLKPEAVCVGRSLVYVVFNGLAVRLRVPAASRMLQEEFDSRGRARKAPVRLCAMTESWALGNGKRGTQSAGPKRDRSKAVKRARGRRYGVRAAGGGITA